VYVELGVCSQRIRCDGCNIKYIGFNLFLHTLGFFSLKLVWGLEGLCGWRKTCFEPPDRERRVDFA
jgi:hypothetical protein